MAWEGFIDWCDRVIGCEGYREDKMVLQDIGIELTRAQYKRYKNAGRMTEFATDADFQLWRNPDFQNMSDNHHEMADAVNDMLNLMLKNGVSLTKKTVQGIYQDVKDALSNSNYHYDLLNQ